MVSPIFTWSTALQRIRHRWEKSLENGPKVGRFCVFSCSGDASVGISQQCVAKPLVHAGGAIDPVVAVVIIQAIGPVMGGVGGAEPADRRPTGDVPRFRALEVLDDGAAATAPTAS